MSFGRKAPCAIALARSWKKCVIGPARKPEILIAGGGSSVVRRLCFSITQWRIKLIVMLKHNLRVWWAVPILIIG
jgi:hypothetical protein